MATRAISTISQFSNKNPAFPPGGIRWAIFNSKENGLAESGAIIRTPGTGKTKRGRVLIIDELYIRWAMGKPPSRLEQHRKA